MRFKTFLLEQINLEKHQTLINNIVRKIVNTLELYKEDLIDAEHDEDGEYFIVSNSYIKEIEDKCVVSLHITKNISFDGELDVVSNHIKLFITKNDIQKIIGGNISQLKSTLIHELTHLLDPYIKNSNVFKKKYLKRPSEIRAFVSELVYDILNQYEKDETYKVAIKNKNYDKGKDILTKLAQKINQETLEKSIEFLEPNNKTNIRKLLLTSLLKTIDMKIKELKNPTD